MLGFRLKNDWVYYALFQYLWLFAILPKALQLVCLGALLCLVLFKSGKEKPLDAFTLLQIGYLAVYGLSIVINLLTAEHELSRVLAAVNTWSISVVAVLFYHCYRHITLDYQRLSRYMFHNVIILLIIYVLYLTLDYRGNFSFMSHPLTVSDWINDAPALRFAGYLEYSNLIVTLMLFCFGLSLRYIQTRFGGFAVMIYSVVCILPIWATNSRMGMLIMPVLAVLAIVLTNSKALIRIYRKYDKLILVGGVILICAVALLLHQQISEMVEQVLNARQGSTDTRFDIYLSSLERMITESPIIGCGIKDMYGYYPYGSHSTYVGVFYKAGLLGGGIFMLSIILAICSIFKNKPRRGYTAVIMVSFLALFAFFALEDLDGANWCITVFMALYGICYGNRNFCATF